MQNFSFIQLMLQEWTLQVGLPVTEKEISGFELYYDMSFGVAYSSFSCLPSGNGCIFICYCSLLFYDSMTIYVGVNFCLLIILS